MKQQTPANGLLVRLSSSSLAQVLRCGERVYLDKRQVIQERHSVLRYAYFIESGAASLITKAGGDRANVELKTLGASDFVGLPLLLGEETSPHRCVMQMPGEALRVRAADLTDLTSKLPDVRSVLFKYAHEVFVHTSQLVACNTRHNLRQRLARWILVASERLGSDRIELTHDRLGHAIAVRRAGITTEIGRMEDAGLIKRGRGSITIMNRDGLENTSCSCHRVLRVAGDARSSRRTPDNRGFYVRSVQGTPMPERK